MKTQLPLLALILTSCFASQLQAQLFQYSEQKGTSNRYTSAEWISDSVFTITESLIGNSGTTASLRAYHESGEELWEISAPDTLEVMSYNNIVELTDSTFGVLGFYQICCDCSPPEPFLEIRSKEDGILLNRIGNVLISDFSQSPFIHAGAGVAKSSWGFSTLTTNFDFSLIHYFSETGDSLHSFGLENDFDISAGFQGDFVVASSEILRRYNSAGIKTDSVAINSTPIAMASNSQRLAILFESELKLYDSNFDEVAEVALSEDMEYDLDGFDSGFALMGEMETYKIDQNGLIIGEGGLLEISGFEREGMIANENLIAVIGSKISAAYTPDQIRHHHAAVRAVDYGGSSPLWHTDLAISNVVIENLTVNNPDFFVNYSADVSVTVQNLGSFPVNSFYLNHGQSDGICFPFFENIFIEETIPNQGEITVSFPSISSWTLPSMEDSVLIQPCVFVTHPNDEIDWDRSNDTGCAGVYVFLSTDERNLDKLVKLYPNPSTDEIRLNTDLRLETYRLVSPLGELVLEGSFNNDLAIRLDNVPNGLYLLYLETDEGRAVKKLVVSK